jgi:quercetin dioxygenase-like cupin family protein
MTVRISIIFLLMLIISNQLIAQHEQHRKNNVQQTSPLAFTLVRSEFLSDSALKDYKLESLIMTVAPGAEDTVSHRHDCDLFGYVLEGKIEIGLDNKTPVIYNTGEMFYEKKRVLHTLAKNSLTDRPTKILLLFIIKEGRKSYINAYPPAAK